MVFRLAPGHSKDEDIRNNNSPVFIVGPGPGPRAGDPYALGPYGLAEEDPDGGEADEGDRDGCCCCCCGGGWLWGRRPAKVTPEKHPRNGVVRDFCRIGDQDFSKGSVLSVNPGVESLTLDSIDDSINDAQFPFRQHALSQGSQKQTARTQAAPAPVSAQQVPHPLAPQDVSDEQAAPVCSPSSGNTSANPSGGSLVSLQASAVTSGYDSNAASPDTDQSGIAQDVNGAAGAVDTNDGPGRTEIIDKPLVLGEDNVDGNVSHQALQHNDDIRITEEYLQQAAISPQHQPEEVKRSDASIVSKKPSVTRRKSVGPGRGVRVPLSRPRANTPGSLASSGGAASLGNLSLSSSLGHSSASLFADSLPGFDNPRDALTRALQQLDSVEWEVTMQALQSMVRLVRHHPALIQGHLHVCCESLARQVRNLRSQVARAACQTASRLFHALKRGMDAEAEDLSTALFNRTADTNKFLRADSNSALDAMTDSILPVKAVSAIVHKGCRHQNAVVRTTGARLLTRLVEKLGVDRVMAQPRETRDLLLLTSARLLMEGSLETRSYAKTLLRNLAQDHRLSMILVEIVPANIMRSIDKTLKSCLMRLSFSLKIPLWLHL